MRDAPKALNHHLDICVGRQPIYNRRREVVAYELLFRRPNATRADVNDGEQATAQVILNTLLEIGIERIAGEEPVFLNCTRRFLESDPLIPPGKCVLEVLEDITLDDRLAHTLRSLKGRGYRIALDDFVYREGVESVIEIADYIKVDLTLLSTPDLERQAGILKSFPATLLAEKIDCEEQFRFCQDLGFDLFQGYFLRRPDVLHQRRAPANALSTLGLISECQDPRADVGSISRAISRDPALSYKLLQLVNSCLFDARTPVDSISRAIQAAGTELLLRWASILVIAGFDDSPSAYLLESLRRARMCEILANADSIERPDRAYMMGLLSVMDSIVNQPMEDLLEPLPLAADFKAALLTGQGPLGGILADVIAWEAGSHPPGSAGNGRLKLIQSAFWDAVDYAREMSRTIGPS